MSFYRPLLAAAAALAFALPAFADEAPATTEQAVQPLAQASEQAAVPSEVVKVDINKATAKDLAKVKGMSPAQAKAIVVYRKKNGDFKSLEDLKNVKSFKKMNVEQMKDLEEQLTTG